MSAIASLLTASLHSLRELHNSLALYLKLAPFTRLVQHHSDALFRLQEVTLPSHILQFSRLVHKYRVQPPLAVAAVRPSVVALLVHTPLPEHYAEAALRNLVAKCGEQLNDGIRELNELELEEKELRGCLICCRDDLEGVLSIFGEQQAPSAVSRAIDWIF